MAQWLEKLSAFFTTEHAPVGMRRKSVQCASPVGLHRMSYVEWGDPRNDKVLICVHGLTRNARDFDFLAQALAHHYRVVCPDVVGRGFSDWLRAPTGYAVPQYVADMVSLIARLDVEQVDWVGTSMGGLIGMGLASLENAPIRKMVLNDVGPVITGKSLKRIGEYVGLDLKFDDMAAAEAYIRRVSAGFGQLSDAQWQHLTEHSMKSADGGFRMRYDPAIAKAFPALQQGNDISLWPVYDAIKCPTVVLRGAQSDLLTPETWAEMGQRGPRATLVEFPNVGHAPMLMDAPQIAAVSDFLLGLE